MEVYILDSLYRRIDVVDKFESLIWTERFSAAGDFELILNSTLQNRTRFLNGVRLVTNESLRVMEVETVEDKTDLDGRRILIVKGRSMEKILDNRLARGSTDSLTATPKWILTGTPKEIAEQIYHDICVTGVFNAGDIIADVTEGSELFPEDSIGAPTEEITYAIDPKTVYAALTELCEAYDMGFRFVRDPSSNLLYFDVYMGSNRTTKQETLPAVVFSPDMDNLKDVTQLTTTAVYKNVAYVLTAVGVEIVYADGVDPSVEGFERQVLVVTAQDINDPTPATASAQAIQRGKEELAKNRQFSGLDGELAPNSTYRYGTDYHLGDMVELRNDDGLTSDMQVAEYIFVSDKEGDRSYPTLAVNTFITAGSWLAWDATQEWDDLGETEYWEDLP